ncbi:MAG TPA: hypothetical protein VI489_00650 [Candidatus Brocadiaceae bacterium]
MKNVQGAVTHLKNDQKYPANRTELLAECDGLSDFSAEDKQWFTDNLPEGNYESAEAVMKALNLQEA